MSLLPNVWRGSRAPSRLVRDDFERLFNNFFTDLGMRYPMRELAGAEAAFIPDVDVIEHDDRYVVRAELPGVSPDRVSINALGNAIEIRGEKVEEHEEENETYFSAERSYGSFVRTIDLPVQVEADKIEAKLENGVLEVLCPKAESTKARRIEVRGGASGEQKAIGGSSQAKGQTSDAEKSEMMAGTESGKASEVSGSEKSSGLSGQADRPRARDERDRERRH